MNIRKIREDLGRAKASIMRKELPRSVFLTIGALKETRGQSTPTEVRSDLRTVVSLIASDPDYKRLNGKPLSYQPGKEKELLRFLILFYKELAGQENKEEYEETLQRKMQLDRGLRDGRAFLAENKVSEADACFADTMKFYRNEFAIYGMMAKAFMDVGEYVRALGHIRSGLKERPDDADLRRLAEECLRLRAAASK